VLDVDVAHPLRTFALELAVAVEPGRCLAVAGASGAGKTTLLRAIAGVVHPERGRIACNGTVWLDTERGVRVPPEDRRCGLLFQHGALFPHLTAAQNVGYGLLRADRERRAHELLDRFGIGHLAGARPRELSGGERQRVALARALAVNPRALLLDEPLSALDARTRASATRELAATLRDASVPAILVTHDFTDAALLGDEVAVLDAGRVVQRGTAAELAAAPTSALVADFTGATVLHGSGRARADGLTEVALDGGGAILSSDRLDGLVAAIVQPWEITLERQEPAGTALNRVPARVASVTTLGNRVRVGLLAPQPLTVEITPTTADALGLAPGGEAFACWKATATRLVGR
jgi:molybdate transport system ATP-binding protein